MSDSTEVLMRRAHGFTWHEIKLNDQSIKSWPRDQGRWRQHTGSETYPWMDSQSLLWNFNVTESTDARSERIQAPGEVINSLSMKMAHLLVVKKEQEEHVKVVRLRWRSEHRDSNLFDCWRTDARKKMKEREWAKKGSRKVSSEDKEASRRRAESTESTELASISK